MIIYIYPNPNQIMKLISNTITHKGQEFTPPDKKGFSVVFHNEHQIIAGTSDCCCGSIYSGTVEVIGEISRLVFKEFVAPTNVLDMIPIFVDHKKTGFMDDQAVLIAGHGCDGKGVFLLSVSESRSIQIMSTNVYTRNSALGPADNCRPRFKLAVDSKLSVAFHNAGFYPKADDAQDHRFSRYDGRNLEWFINPVPGNIIDLTSVLETYGFSAENTFKILQGMEKWEGLRNKLPT